MKLDAVKTLKDVLKDIPEDLQSKVYLVGGCIRDILEQRDFVDIDLAVEEDVSKDIIRFIPGNFIVLDQQRDISRIIFIKQEQSVQIDLVKIDKGGIEENLKKRDFTINAMAIPLDKFNSGGKIEHCLIDPLGGKDDLQERIIKTCNLYSIEEDALRALRAFRLSLNYQYTISEETLKVIKNSHKTIKECSGERIWDELLKIFSHKKSYSVIEKMDEIGVLQDIFPEFLPLKGLEQGGYHVVDAWEHSLQTFRYFEILLNGNYFSDLEDELGKYLNEKVTRINSRLPIIKFALLVHDIGKQVCQKSAGNGRYTFYNHSVLALPLLEKISERLKLGKNEKDLLQILVKEHMSPLILYTSGADSKKAINRLFLRGKENTLGILFLSLADVFATRVSAGDEKAAFAYLDYILGLMKTYLNEGRIILNLPKLISGNEICNVLQIEPSPKVGEILTYLKNAQIAGHITNKEEAIDFVKRVFGREIKRK